MCADNVAAAMHQGTDTLRIRQEPHREDGTLPRDIPAKDC